jgi:uncharacterized phage protein (TIGR02216 family)
MSWFAGLARSASMLATGQLGWPPDQFWQATPAELQASLDGRFGAGASAPLGRAELAELETKVIGDGG